MAAIGHRRIGRRGGEQLRRTIHVAFSCRSLRQRTIAGFSWQGRFPMTWRWSTLDCRARYRPAIVRLVWRFSSPGPARRRPPRGGCGRSGAATCQGTAARPKAAATAGSRAGRRQAAAPATDSRGGKRPTPPRPTPPSRRMARPGGQARCRRDRCGEPAKDGKDARGEVASKDKSGKRAAPSSDPRRRRRSSLATSRSRPIRLQSRRIQCLEKNCCPLPPGRPDAKAPQARQEFRQRPASR